MLPQVNLLSHTKYYAKSSTLHVTEMLVMLLRYLIFTPCQIKMLCYLEFASCNEDDAALLNVILISSDMSLVKKLSFCFALK